ncbi:MAG: SPOR domain-containing protein [Pseudomonadota bacterium]
MKPQPYNRKKRFFFELSRTQTFFCIAGALFVLSWAFILGIFVGRGYVSDTITQAFHDQVRKLQAEKKALTDKYLAQEKKAEIPQDEIVKPRLDFFNNKLSRKGNENIQVTAPQPTPKPPVELEVKKESQAPSPEAKVPKEQPVTFSESGAFLVQIGSYREEATAQSSVKRLHEKGYQAFLKTKEIPQKGGKWFRVQVGPLKTRAEAEKMIKKLEHDGFHAVLLNSND